MMGKVVSSAAMSLDGFVAKEDNTIGRLFDWLGNGETEVATADPAMTMRCSPQSAAYLREWMGSLGAIIVGRTLFDVADGWGGRHTMGIHVVAVTHDVPTGWMQAHPDAAVTFVTDGVAAAVAAAQELAGDKTVAVAAGTIARQCLELGLLDEVRVDLVPVVMGEGRPYFGAMGLQDVMLGDPTTRIAGDRVTHLAFPVLR